MSEFMMQLSHPNLVLPPKGQCLTTDAFRHLVEKRQAEIEPQLVNPVALARPVDIEPDPWYEEIFCSIDSRVSIQGVRLSGKSTITSLIAVHTAHVTPEGLVQVLLLSLHQAQELLAVEHRGRFFETKT